MRTTPVRVLIAKVGLDGHDRGAKFVAQALRDRGYEVIYTGIRRTPEEVVNIAITEDVQFLGISTLSGGHKALCPKVASLLKAQGASDIILFAGGIIPPTDLPTLQAQGVRAVFGPGTSIDQIVAFMEKAHAKPARVA
ncbi:MAG TPA: cobalamin B12-binding domain-containing protein [Verrucomicrobiota bacterium]|nr:methylmalonyl-CoA mutase [Verrucomicrobiales bacterium]HRI11754.1 cobalamin B12-binding domain-containing protein [Verrucomicrobiota bacterium]